MLHHCHSLAAELVHLSFGAGQVGWGSYSRFIGAHWKQLFIVTGEKADESEEAKPKRCILYTCTKQYICHTAKTFANRPKKLIAPHYI